MPGPRGRRLTAGVVGLFLLAVLGAWLGVSGAKGGVILEALFLFTAVAVAGLALVFLV